MAARRPTTSKNAPAWVERVNSNPPDRIWNFGIPSVDAGTFCSARTIIPASTNTPARSTRINAPRFTNRSVGSTPFRGQVCRILLDAPTSGDSIPGTHNRAQGLRPFRFLERQMTSSFTVSRFRVRYSLLLLAVLLLLAPVSASAQAVYGSIGGIITDSSGAIVPGATVTITSVERKTSDSVVTNESGYYVKERLLPGTYEVKAELQGFKTAVYPAVKVSVDTQTALNVKLDTGAVSETVTVAGFSPVLKTDRADVATTFDAREITELPVLDRNFTKLILLTPGTQQLGWQHAASENPQGSTQTMVNGQNFSGTGYQLDGTDNRDPVLGIIVINPNFEAIGESKITSQNYDAEFGQAIAGVVSVQTKSGTNAFHGSAFEFLQRDKFRARNPFSEPDVVNPVTGHVLPQTKRDQFGGSIGGPIVKNEWFFFGDYQGTRSNV